MADGRTQRKTAYGFAASLCCCTILIAPQHAPGSGTRAGLCRTFRRGLPLGGYDEGKQAAEALANTTIELIIGCMFSGKTTELIRRIEALEPSAKLVTLKPAIDDRYSPTHIVTHHRQTAAAQTVHNAGAILDHVGDAEVVAIDEIHFFDDAIVDVCQGLAKRGVRVICTGLDRDMWGDVFPHVERLSQIADTAILTAECNACGQPANRTHRTVPLIDGNLVGGPGEFEPRCEKCFSPPSAPKPADTTGLAQPPP